jgi:hypothetical protein
MEKMNTITIGQFKANFDSTIQRLQGGIAITLLHDEDGTVVGYLKPVESSFAYDNTPSFVLADDPITHSMDAPMYGSQFFSTRKLGALEHETSFKMAADFNQTSTDEFPNM